MTSIVLDLPIHNHYYYENHSGIHANADADASASSLHIYMPTRLDSSGSLTSIGPSVYDMNSHYTRIGRLHSNSSSSENTSLTFTNSNSISNSNSSYHSSADDSDTSGVDLDLESSHHTMNINELNLLPTTHSVMRQNTDTSTSNLLEPLPSLQLKAHDSLLPLPTLNTSFNNTTLTSIPLNSAAIEAASNNSNNNSGKSTTTSTRTKRMGNTRGRKGSNASSNNSTHSDHHPYDRQMDRHEYRKIRHRQTDTERRIRIKTLLEDLRQIIYPNKNNKVEQSQIIQDSLVFIESLKQENATLKQRVEVLEQEIEKSQINTTTAVDTAIPVTLPVSVSQVANDTKIQRDNGIKSGSFDSDTHHYLVGATTQEDASAILFAPVRVPSSSSISISSPISETPINTDHLVNSAAITVYRIPEPMRNMNIAIWVTSLDGRWLDMNTVFHLTTRYKLSDLQYRSTSDYPAYSTAILREDDPYDTEYQIEKQKQKQLQLQGKNRDRDMMADNDNDYHHNSVISSMLSSQGEVPLGLGCKLYTDSWIFQRASQTPLLFNAYWLDAKKRRRATKFMARVMMDERDMKPAYVLNIFYR